MPFAYVTDPRTMIRSENNRLTITRDGELVAEWPIVHLDGLAIRGPVHITTPAICQLLRQGITTSFFTATGQLLGQATPVCSSNAMKRLAQYRSAFDPRERLRMAKLVVLEKQKAMMDLLRRYRENHPSALLRDAQRRIADLQSSIQNATSTESLLGLEGTCALRYWSAFPQLLRTDLEFNGRSRRPPLDPVNSLLSAGYCLLTRELISAVSMVGLDPYVGFYHEIKSGRPSLALDLVEPFRHFVVDRLVVRGVNLRQFRQEHFWSPADSKAVYLTREGWRHLCIEFEEIMTSPPNQNEESESESWRDRIRRACSEFVEKLSHFPLERPGKVDDESTFDSIPNGWSEG
jgi:CRISPR-associated protein Cas1